MRGTHTNDARTTSWLARCARPTRLATIATALALVLAGTATAAFVGLPADGSQVDSDIAAGIDPARDAGVSDVQGGTVVAGNLQVPWATFEHKTATAQQIFVRAFKGGQWVTQGFPASLNIDPTVEAEAPAIDFAGTAPNGAVGRVVRAERESRQQDPDLREQILSLRERLAALGAGTGTWPLPAVAQHQHEPRRREPGRRRRRRSRRQRPGAVGGVAGARRRRSRQESDLRVPRRQVDDGHALPRQAGERRSQPERLLLAAGRPRPDRPGDGCVLGDR